MILKNPPRMTNRESVSKYIETDLWTWLKSISTTFLKLNFQDNFQSFTIPNLSIPAGQEVAIPNGFQGKFTGLIPNGRIISRQTGDANIIDGPTPWTSSIVYLQNPSINDAVVTVIFFY